MITKIAKWILQKSDHFLALQQLLCRDGIQEELQLLEPMGSRKEELEEKYRLEKLSLCILVLLGGLLLSVVLMLQEQAENSLTENRIYRTEYGEGSSYVTLYADNGEEQATVELEISERSYTQEELAQLYEQFVEELEEAFLGENPSPEEITRDVCPLDSLEGYPFTVMWILPEAYIDYQGRLLQEELPQPVLVEIMARIQYADTAGSSFARDETFFCYLHSRASPTVMKEALEEELIKREQESLEQAYVELPQTYQEKKLIWQQSALSLGLLFLLATPLLAAVISYGKDRDVHRKVMEREEQMKQDYPEIVSKLALLIGAGMTLQAAWNRIVADYCNRKQTEKKERFAYEEMRYTLRELENGYSPKQAYEHFGKRCRVLCYTRLSALLAQNMKKGSANLTQLLYEEAQEALDERKHAARSLGEKAGTKLLLPMMMLLAEIMISITVPAFMAYLG